MSTPVLFPCRTQPRCVDEHSCAVCAAGCVTKTMGGHLEWLCLCFPRQTHATACLPLFALSVSWVGKAPAAQVPPGMGRGEE